MSRISAYDFTNAPSCDGNRRFSFGINGPEMIAALRDLAARLESGEATAVQKVRVVTEAKQGEFTMTTLTVAFVEPTIEKAP